MHAVLRKKVKSKGTKSSKKPGLHSENLRERQRKKDRQISRPFKDQVYTIEGVLFSKIQS